MLKRIMVGAVVVATAGLGAAGVAYADTATSTAPQTPGNHADIRKNADDRSDDRSGGGNSGTGNAKPKSNKSAAKPGETAGTDAAGTGAAGTDAAGTSAYGASPYASPYGAYGGTQYTNPAYGGSSYGGTAYGQSPYGTDSNSGKKSKNKSRDYDRVRTYPNDTKKNDPQDLGKDLLGGLINK